MTNNSYREAMEDKTLVVKLEMDGKEVGVLAAPYKDFSTGSQGFYANGKVDIAAGGERAKHTVNISLVAVGSKDGFAKKE